MVTIEKVKDPLTEELFIPRRRNQRFASRINQVTFNNIRASQYRLAKKAIDAQLNKNRKILKKLLGENAEFIDRKLKLLSLGYNFNIHTHNLLIDKELKKYADCVYEFTLERIDNENYKISYYGR